MRVLWLSWRDTRNPEAGGAEVFAHEVTRRLVGDYDHDVTLFTASFAGGTDQEDIDGVKVVREGGKYSVYGRAKRYYLANQDSFDIIVDEMNTKPFLTPKYVSNKQVIGLVHQVPRKGLFYELPFPVNYITYHYLVKRWFSTYRNVPTMTVSLSQQEILKEFGFRKTLVVPEGLSVKPLEQVPVKNSVPTIVFMGRLKGYKLPDHAVKAFSLIKKRIHEAKMFVIGDGYMRSKLEKMAHKDVTFLGRVSDQAKYDLVKKAHVLMVPSVEEGWGLVVTEANAMGTPAIAYNVAGLHDSVRDGTTGILTEQNTPESMADAAISLLNDKDRLKLLSEEALRYAKTFSWDNTTAVIEEIIRRQGH